MLTVEVRDRSLNRKGQVGNLDFTVTKLFNGVGKWQLKVASDDPMTPFLKEKGSGIVCRFEDQYISGRTTSGVVSEDASDPYGTWVFEGLTDDEQIAAKGVLPVGNVEPDAQTQSHYVASGPFESVAKVFVDSQIGSGALARRRAVSVAPDLGRGETVRFEELRAKNVLEVLQDRSVTGGLGFHVVQADDALVFDVYEPRDLTRRVQLDVWNGGLTKAEWGFKSPTVTEVWALGQGEGAARTLSVVTTPEAEAEALLQGIRYDTSIDRRDTNDTGVMDQDALELLAESGVSQHSVKVDPAFVPNMRFGVDWWLGDLVTVTADAVPMQSRVNQVTISVNKDAPVDAPIILVGVGELTGFKPERQLRSDVSSQDRRISALERNSSGSVFLTGRFDVTVPASGRVDTLVTIPAQSNSTYEITVRTASSYLLPFVHAQTTAGFTVGVRNIIASNLGSATVVWQVRI